MKTFCDDIYYDKRIFKCIPLLEKKCYVFIGNYQERFLIESIKKNIKNEDPFEGVDKMNKSEEKIKRLHNYLTNKIIDDMNNIKKEIINILFIKDHTSIFINYLINEDDTNEKVLMKISENCYNISDPTPSKYIYAYYENTDNNIDSLGIEYNDLTFDPDIINNDPCDLIDEIMIDKNGEQIYIEKTNKYLYLFENNKLKNNNLYFISLKDYLIKKDIFENIQENMMDDCDIKSFYNGMIYKYWPKVSKEEFINYNNEELLERKLNKKESESEILKKYIAATKIINRKKKKEIECDSFEIKYMRIIKKSKETKNINITNIFGKSYLSESVPFSKLILNSYNEKYFKLFKDSIIYNGMEEDISENQLVDQELCKEWSDDFSIKSKYKNSVQYIHPSNVIIFKVYKEDIKDIYCSLIIHTNGDIECIIKQRKNIKSFKKTSVRAKEDILILIDYCNRLINIINQISETPIDDFGENIEDIFENKGDLIVDFIDCSLSFDKLNFKVNNGIEIDQVPNGYKDEFSPFKIGNQFPNWSKLIGSFMEKLPMYFRIKHEQKENIDDEDIIYGHYNRVNNYANKNAIQSAITAYSNIYSDNEIISFISKEFDKSLEEAKIEYELWSETNKMREKNKENLINVKNTYNLNIEEDGADVIIRKKSSDRYLTIDITNSKSFKELNRIIIVIKSIIEMYDNYINDSVSKGYKKYFETSEQLDYDELNDEKEEEEKIKEEDLKKDADIFDILNSDSDDSDDSFLNSTSDSDDQMGGAKYKVKSYYLNRLKEYDRELFVFQSNKWQTNKKGEKTIRYGYPKVCTASKQQPRQPISVTDEELEIINKTKGSGRNSYSYAISIPGRPQNIKYICPQYWDMGSNVSIHPKYVDKSNVVPLNAPQTSNKSILKRDGSYWNGVPNDDEISAKYFIPGIIGDGIHPKGYGLPCCMSNTKRSKIYKPGDNVFWINKDSITIYGTIVEKDKDKKDKIHYIVRLEDTGEEKSISVVELNHIKKSKKEETELEPEPQSELEPGPQSELETEPQPELETETLLEEATIGNIQQIGNIIIKDETKPGQYAKLPSTLLKLFGQDKITNYDEVFKVSKGFLRKGVPHGKYEIDNSKKITMSSFITSIIEIIYSDENNGIKGYDDCVKINDIIKLLEEKKKEYDIYIRDKIKKQEEIDENNEMKKEIINITKELNLSIKLFVKRNIIKEFEEDISKFQLCSSIIRSFRKTTIDDRDKIYIKKILKKKNNFDSKELIEKIDDIKSLKKNESIYLLNLLLSLKSYGDYLLSDEEKEIEVVAPSIQLLFGFDIILFENIENRIKIRDINSLGNDKVVFIYKKNKHYEPLVYRINRKGDELKIYDNKEFETSIPHGVNKLFKNEDYKEYFENNTYPRGRRSLEKLQDRCRTKGDKTFCSEWVKCTSKTQLIPGDDGNIRLKWIEGNTKKYALVLEFNEESNIIKTTEGDVDIDVDEIFVKLKKRVVISEIKTLLENKKWPWKWIDKSCSNYISDINIEALIRRKKHPKKDKLLFDYSVGVKNLVDNDVTDELLELIQSEFFMLIDIVKNIKDQIKNKKKENFDNITNKGYNIEALHLNSYSEVSYIIAEKENKTYIIPSEKTYPLPIDNNYKLIYELNDEYYNTIEETIDYLKELKFKPEILIKNKDNQIITILLENDIYIPIMPTDSVNKKISNKISIINSDCNLLDIEKNLYINNSESNILTQYIDNYDENKNEIKKMNYKILSQIEKVEKIIEGKISELKTKKDNIIYFTRKGRDINLVNKTDYIHRNIYSKNRNNLNVVLKGYVIDIKNENIKIKVLLKDIIENIISDNILIPEHKRINIYNYIHYSKNRDIKIIDSEPRINKNEINEDPQKIKEFVNSLLIFGFDKFKNNLSDNFDIKKYKEQINNEEIIYTYEEYRFLEKLNDIFTKRSSFKDTTVNDIDDLDNPIIKYKKVDTIPYYINQLYGPGTKVLYHLNDVNNDLLNIRMGVNQTLKKRLPLRNIKENIKNRFNEEKVTDKDLLDKYNTELFQRDKILNRKTEEYKEIQKISEAMDKNIVHINDLELLIKSLDVNDENNIDKKGLLTDIAILLISYDKNKKPSIYFFSTKELYQDTKVISFHHTLIEYIDPGTNKRDKSKDKYIISNIIRDGKYYSTVKELFDTNEEHKKWIKKEDNSEIIYKVTPPWLDSINDKEGLEELLNEKTKELKQTEKLLSDIEKKRKEEKLIKEEKERINKEIVMIEEKIDEKREDLEEMED
tara:strand:- start:1778 stop:8518 length:6741 start_codon:yes stop_codon:yes gene_type:complete